MRQKQNFADGKLLVGNTFPLTLIRRRVVIEPVAVTELRRSAAGKKVISFWGHADTLAAAMAAAGIDLTPAAERPVLSLSPDGLVVCDGLTFDRCWIVSPDSRQIVRPAIGQVADAAAIVNWQCLKITWL